MTEVVACRATKRWKRTRGRGLGIDEVSFEAFSGEIIGIVGPNGAGKSTLLRLMSGVARLTCGTLTIDGRRAGSRAARRAVGYAADPPRMPPELSGLEWLHYLASHRADSRSHRLRLVQWAVELIDSETFVDRRIRTYSRGMAQRLAFAAAAIAGTSVITLDETLGGVDPIVHRKLRRRVRELGNGGRTIFVASHDLATVETIATRVLVLVAGRVAADVSTAALLDRRVAELTVAGDSARGAERLLLRYPDGERTDLGVAIPLRKGLSIEHVLAACREERLPIAHTRTRFETLEDILLRAMSGRRGK
jgi:ABC-2 type transport system ATP-binding protein